MPPPLRHGRRAARSRRRPLCSAIVLAAACPCAAQEGIPAPPPSEPEAPPALRLAQPPYTIQFEPSVWYASPGGKLRMPGGSSTHWIDTFNLDSPRLSPYGELHLREGNWRLGFCAMSSREHPRGPIQNDFGEIGGVGFGPGDRTPASLDFTTFQAEVGYRLPISGVATGKEQPEFLATNELVAGVRFYDFRFDLDLPSGHTGAHEVAGTPYIGLRLAMEIVYGFTVDVEASLAGFDDGRDLTIFGSDIVVGVMW